MTEPRPPRHNIVVRNNDIRKYFSNKEWRELSGYEKEQTRNVLRNHLVMISCGIKAPLPFFMTNFEARRNEAANEQSRQNVSSGSKKIGKSHPVKVKVSPREGPPSQPIATGPPKRRGRPPKRKAALAHDPGRGKGPQMPETTIPLQADKIASLIDSTLTPEPQSCTQPAANLKNPPDPTSLISKENGTVSTRQQPPRLSKTLGEILIKERVRPYRKPKVV